MNKHRFNGHVLRKIGRIEQKCDRIEQKCDRIEQKCDRILSEIIIMRHALADGSISEALESLHASAARMREMCKKERSILSGRYGS